MQIEKVPIKKINPAPYNPRKDLKPGDPEYDKLKRSILEFDMVEPLVWNKQTGNLVGGHQRLKILIENGETSVDCSVVDLSKSKEKALNIALNKIQGEWDFPKLRDLLLEIDTGEFDIDITGFDAGELEQLVASYPLEGSEAREDEFDVDKALEDIEEPKTKRGDIIELGRHRLMCGDSVDGPYLGQLLEGVKADAIITDPPYAIYGSSTGVSAEIADDNMVRPFWRSILALAVASTPMSAHVYIFCDWRSYPSWFGEIKSSSLRLVNVIVWDKGDGGLGAMYTNRHEFIMFLENIPQLQVMTKKKKGKSKVVYGYANVQRFNILQGKSRHHNAGKPIELVGVFVDASTEQDEVVFDPFVGSGTTIIASEQLDRICYAMEIDPKYCDVIVERWQTFTGKKAKYLKE
jgi:DNA modification methylase